MFRRGRTCDEPRLHIGTTAILLSLSQTLSRSSTPTSTGECRARVDQRLLRLGLLRSPFLLTYTYLRSHRIPHSTRSTRSDVTAAVVMTYIPKHALENLRKYSYKGVDRQAICFMSPHIHTDYGTDPCFRDMCYNRIGTGWSRCGLHGWPPTS